MIYIFFAVITKVTIVYLVGLELQYLSKKIHNGLTSYDVDVFKDTINNMKKKSEVA